MSIPSSQHLDPFIRDCLDGLKRPEQSVDVLLAWLNAHAPYDWRLFELTDDPSVFLSRVSPFTTIQLSLAQHSFLLKAWPQQWEHLSQEYGWGIPLEAPQQPGRLLGLLVARALPPCTPELQQLLETSAVLLTHTLYLRELVALAQPEHVEQALLAWLTTPEQSLDEATVERHARYLRVDLHQRHLIALLSAPKESYPQLAAQVRQRYPGSLVSFHDTLLAWLDLATASVEDVQFWLQQQAATLSQQNVVLSGGLSKETTQAPCHIAYQEAFQAWSEATKHQAGGILAAQQIGIRQFITLSPAFKDDPCYQFIADVDQHDSEGIYLPTLRRYLNARNVSQAARDLQVHENTIRSRMRILQHIADRFSIHLDAPNWFDLSLALLLYEQNQSHSSPFSQ